MPPRRRATRGRAPSWQSYLLGLPVFPALIGMVARLGDLERFADLIRRVEL
ncbi:hypothetical protein HAV22_05050 [Massilia sp. TW-1]|uniref:Uncharacterized protein n=1 Tax=Telluria antibiotica TaxID=2717319 RepID=A0ABX0P7X3_9BURK|nr:hypothetical protein [Telluria antibiotica]NIA53021.1 hypothetical protein [Telluria antibiotica]